MDIDYQRTERAFVDLGMSDFGQVYSQMRQTDLFDRWEVGALGREDFVRTLKGYCAHGTSDDQVVDAWNAMLIGFPLGRLQLLRQLSLHYDLFLLSNTNEIHEEAFERMVFSVCGYPSVAHFFDKAYYSHRMGMRKPHPETFKKVLEDNHLSPAHTLFIDDSPQHIAGADSVGLRTIWLGPGKTIERDVFRPLTDSGSL